jgi:hypothetical protein
VAVTASASRGQSPGGATRRRYPARRSGAPSATRSRSVRARSRRAGPCARDGAAWARAGATPSVDGGARGSQRRVRGVTGWWSAGRRRQRRRRRAWRLASVPRGVRKRNRINAFGVFSRDTGRPRRVRLFHLQKSRKPRRCHARTVSGFTMTMATRHPCQIRDNQTHNTRSTRVSSTRRGRVRSRTWS